MNYKKREIYSLALVLVYFLMAILPLVYATFTEPAETHDFLNELSLSFAFIAIPLLILSLVIGSRFKFLDKVFGLDRLMSFHRKMGIFIFLLILAHPLLLGISRGDLLFFLVEGVPWYILAGFFTVILLLIHVFLALYRVQLKMPWEAWRITHDIFAVLILAGALVHSWLTGSDLENPVLQGLWIMLAIAAIIIVPWHLFFRYHASMSHHYIVDEVIEEANEAYTIKMKAEKGKVYSYLPGQFHFIRFKSDEVSAEEHHFTISSSYTRQDYISSTIKNLGDYTSRVHKVKKGDKAIIDGPYGHFSYKLQKPAKELVFIAGGIGITPLRSMIKHADDNDEDLHITLMYANKTVHDIAFRDELEKLAAAKPGLLTLVHVLSEAEESWKGERGFVTEELLLKYGGENLHQKQFYICGPAPMITGVISILKQKGVSPEDIHAEIFALAESFVPATARYRRMNLVTALLITAFLITALVLAAIRSYGDHEEHDHAIKLELIDGDR